MQSVEYVEQVRGRCLVLDQSCLSVRLHPWISVWGQKIYVYRFINKQGREDGAGERMEQEAWYGNDPDVIPCSQTAADGDHVIVCGLSVFMCLSR